MARGSGYWPVLKGELRFTPEIIIDLFRRSEIYVFGYGSLLHSAGWRGRELSHRIKPEDLTECDLRDYRRGPYGRYGSNNFYGIVREKGSIVNGVVVKIQDPISWYHLMRSECVAGIFRYYNYRVVDVTDSISASLPSNARVHVVCNEPVNMRTYHMTWPAMTYYDRVWKGVCTERSLQFQKMFLKLGGFKSNQQVRDLIHFRWRKRMWKEKQ